MEGTIEIDDSLKNPKIRDRHETIPKVAAENSPLAL